MKIQKNLVIFLCAVNFGFMILEGIVAGLYLPNYNDLHIWAYLIIHACFNFNSIFNLYYLYDKTIKNYLLYIPTLLNVIIKIWGVGLFFGVEWGNYNYYYIPISIESMYFLVMCGFIFIYFLIFGINKLGSKQVVNA